MSFLTRLASGHRAAPAIATRPAPAAAGVRAPVVATSNLQYTAAGLPMVPSWDAQSAVEQGYLGHPAVYSAVRAIAETIAALPFRAGKNPGKPAEYDENAPLARLLGPPIAGHKQTGPNPTTSSRALWAWSIAQRIVTGRMGWELERKPGSKQIVNIWPLVSQYLQPIPTVSVPGRQAPTTYFAKYRYNLPTGFIDLNAEKVFYSWRPSQSDWRQPETVMQAARIPINIAIGLNRYQWGMLNNGMAGRKLIVTPPFAEDDQRRAWQEQFIAEMTGFDNAGKPAFGEATADVDPTSGKSAPPSIQVIDLAQTSTDAELMALMEYVERAIYKAFSVPESEIGDASQRTYSNAGEEYRVFWTRTIVPLISEIADDINTYLAPQLGDEVGWFDLSGVEALRPAKLFADVAPDNALKAGMIVPGEWREDVGLPWDIPSQGEDPKDEQAIETPVDDPGIEPSTHASSSRGTRTAGDVPDTSAMVALFIPAATAKKLAVAGGLPASDLHVTLAFLGNDLTPDQAKTARTVVAAVAAQHAPLAGQVGGLGHFPAGEDGTPYYAPVDVPGLERLREAVVTQLVDAGVPVVRNHGFTPHTTLTYLADGDEPPASVPATKVAFDELGLAVGPERTVYPLGGQRSQPSHEVIDRINVLVASRQQRAAGERYDTSPIGLKKNWVTDVGGLPLFIRAIAHALIRNGHTESEAIQLAVGIVKNWASGRGKVSPKTKAKAAAAVAEWEAKKTASHAKSRANGGLIAPEVIAKAEAAMLASHGTHYLREPAPVETESGSAGLLLPKASTAMAPKRRHRPAHVFTPSAADRRKCATCALGVTARTHVGTGVPKRPTRAVEVRHRGPHLPVTGGHANTPDRARQAVRKMIDRHVGTLEQQMSESLRKLFADQQRATVSRMNGNRGKQMIKAALRAASTQPDEASGAGEAAAGAAAGGHEQTPYIDPAHIFDQTFWTERTANDVRPIMTAISSWVPGHFATHTPGVADVEDDSAAVQSVQDLLAQATNRIAGQITHETFDQLTNALTEGVIAGDGYSGLASRVQQVFDQADRVRAERISRTEVQSAVNAAQDSYSANLPEGVIGGREWLATPDDRTRPAHAAAEGQRRAIGEPFQVGEASLMFPGDPSGPPDEVIQCRCVLLYLPAAKEA